MNCKSEFLLETTGKQILCAEIKREDDWDCETGETVYRFTASLKKGFSQSDYESFLTLIDFDYDAGYGGQEVFGFIWYTDGTWSERGEYDGSEWWNYKRTPEIPENLN